MRAVRHRSSYKRKPSDKNGFKLSKIAYNVHTNKGVLNLPRGKRIGGNPKNFIVITKKTKLVTTGGVIEAKPGTKIDCEHEPGEPDPCDAS